MKPTIHFNQMSQHYQTIEQSYVAQTYESIASQFDKTRYKIWPTTKSQIDSVLQSLETSAVAATTDHLQILEVGCGNGRNLEAIKDQLATPVRVIGIEPCQALYQIITAKKTLDETVNCGHFSPDLAQFREQIDVVLSIAVIHHLASSARRLEAIRELVNLAKPNGWIIIQVMALHDNRAMVKWRDLYAEQTENVESGDYLIPWIRTGDYRFYHLFVENELEQLVARIENVEIINSFSDRSNYGVLLRKNK